MEFVNRHFRNLKSLMRYLIIIAVTLSGCLKTNHSREYYPTGELKSVTIDLEVINDTATQFEFIHFERNGQVSYYCYGNKNLNTGINSIYHNGKIDFIGQCDYNGVGNGFSSLHFEDSDSIRVIVFLKNGKKQGLRYQFNRKGILDAVYSYENGKLLDSFNFNTAKRTRAGYLKPEWLKVFNYDSAKSIERLILKTRDNRILHRDQLTTVFERVE